MNNQIIASIASIPSRESLLKKCIDSILMQVDHLYVYLNEYKKIPDFIFNDKITAYSSNKYGDLADIGKFFALQNFHNHDSYLFTLDDDLLYPVDYVQVMVKKLKFYKDNVFICVHGNILPKQSLTSYYKEKIGLHYAKKLLHDTPVDIPGTGTLAFHSKCYQVNLKDFIKPFMTDIWMYNISKKNNIPVIAIEREDFWIRSLINSPDKLSIYNKFYENDSLPTKIVNTILLGDFYGKI